MNAIEKMLIKTSPDSDVATTLYPHQKKALTFLLDREHEKPLQEGQFSTLWRSHIDHMSQQKRWVNLVTEEETPDEPKEAKGAILADDVCQQIYFCHILSLSCAKCHSQPLTDGVL